MRETGRAPSPPGRSGVDLTFLRLNARTTSRDRPRLAQAQRAGTVVLRKLPITASSIRADGGLRRSSSRTKRRSPPNKRRPSRTLRTHGGAIPSASSRRMLLLRYRNKTSVGRRCGHDVTRTKGSGRRFRGHGRRLDPRGDQYVGRPLGLAFPRTSRRILLGMEQHWRWLGGPPRRRRRCSGRCSGSCARGCRPTRRRPRASCSPSGPCVLMGLVIALIGDAGSVHAGRASAPSAWMLVAAHAVFGIVLGNVYGGWSNARSVAARLVGGVRRTDPTKKGPVSPAGPDRFDRR